MEGTAALEAARAREAAASTPDGVRRRDDWQPCASSLTMGHVRAVDWAQLGHANFSRTHGGLLDEEVLLYRSAVPRSSMWDGLMLDDRVVMQEVRPGSGPGRSLQADAALRAYPSVGLEAKASKRKRGDSEAEFWDAHVHGSAGWVRVNDSGLLRPVGATLELCELGFVTGDLWRSALGLWSNALLYRRCAYALLDDAFAWHPPHSYVSRIPHRAKVELLSLLVLSPLFWTNLRAPVATELAATDASEHTCTVVSASVTPLTAAELWRVHRTAGSAARLRQM